MFIFKENVDIKSCQNCNSLKELSKTKGFPTQTQCSNPNISCQQDCEKLNPFLHQCDNCALLGKKTGKDGKAYRTCYDATNTNFFGRWWRAVGEHAYFRRNIECITKKMREK